MNKKFKQDLKNLLLSQLEGVAVKAAVKAILGTAAGVGFKAWLVKFVVTELYEEAAEPAVKAAIVEGGFQIRKYQGGIVLRKIKKAQEEGNAEEYDRGVDDILD